MRRKQLLASPQGCFILILNLIGFIANIKGVIDFVNDINNNVPRQFAPPKVFFSDDLLWSGAILFYAMIAMALLAWVIVQSRALGDFQSLFSAVILQILGSILFVISYFYKFSIRITVENLFGGAILFIILPLSIGYFILTLWLSSRN